VIDTSRGSAPRRRPGHLPAARPVATDRPGASPEVPVPSALSGPRCVELEEPPPIPSRFGAFFLPLRVFASIACAGRHRLPRLSQSLPRRSFADRFPVARRTRSVHRHPRGLVKPAKARRRSWGFHALRSFESVHGSHGLFGRTHPTCRFLKCRSGVFAGGSACFPFGCSSRPIKGTHRGSWAFPRAIRAAAFRVRRRYCPELFPLPGFPATSFQNAPLEASLTLLSFNGLGPPALQRLAKPAPGQSRAVCVRRRTNTLPEVLHLPLRTDRRS